MSVPVKSRRAIYLGSVSARPACPVAPAGGTGVAPEDGTGVGSENRTGAYLTGAANCPIFLIQNQKLNTFFILPSLPCRVIYLFMDVPQDRPAMLQ